MVNMELNLSLLLLLLLLIPPFLWMFFVKNYCRKTSLLPPGPPCLPLIGNLHQINLENLPTNLYLLSKQYGPFMSLRLGSITLIVLSSAEAAKEALATHDKELSSRPRFYSHMKITHDGLNMAFAPYGEYWRQMRKISVHHLLSAKRVLSFRSVRENEVSVSRSIKTVSELASQSNPVNLSEITLYLVNSIICRMSFGKRYDDGDENREDKTKSKFQDLLHEVQAALGALFLRDYFPYMGWVDKLMGKTACVDKVSKDLDLFLQQVINDHLHNLERKIKGDHDYEHHQEDDIIDVLLQLQQDHSLPLNLTMDHIKCQIMDIFVAGTDTSSATMVWTMTELIKNPRVMNKVQQEIRSIVNHDYISEDDLDKLTYLKAVVKETFRLHPPASLVVRHLTTRVCRINGHEIQPGNIVYINLWAIGRDPEYWDNPDEFYPERFLESAKNIDFKGQDFGFIPFGAGRRGCPGLNLGVVMVELALANLLYGFKWELPIGMKKEDINLDINPGVIMHKKTDLILMAKEY